MKINIILKVCALLSLIVFLAYSVSNVPRVTQGFTAYYTFSRMLLEGDDINRSYDNPYFNSRINDYGIKNIYDIQNNLPTTSLAYLPAAWLDPSSAKKAWGILSFVFILFITALILKIYDIKLTQDNGLMTAIIIFLWHPLYQNMALGQIYILLLFLFMLAMLGIRRRGAILAPIAIALDVMLKGYGLIVYLWMLMTKRYKIFFISVLILLIIFLVTLPLVNLNAWNTYSGFARVSLGRSPYDSNTAYQSVNGFLRHVFVYDNSLNPHAILNLPEPVVFLLAVIINLAIIIFILSRTYGKQDNVYSNMLAISALIAVSVITSPVAEEHPYVLFLPLTAGLLRLLFIEYSMTTKILFVISILLLLLPIPFKALGQSAFPLYLVAYPKLYGGILMLFVYSFAGKKIAKTEIPEQA